MAMEINTKYDFTVQNDPWQIFRQFWPEIHQKKRLFLQ